MVRPVLGPGVMDQARYHAAVIRSFAGAWVGILGGSESRCRDGRGEPDPEGGHLRSRDARAGEVEAGLGGRC